MKACPVAGCEAKLYRTRDVERDDHLRRLLKELPSHVEAVWVRGDELRTTAPATDSQGGRDQHAARGKRGRDEREGHNPRKTLEREPRKQARKRSILVE